MVTPLYLSHEHRVRRRDDPPRWPPLLPPDRSPGLDDRAVPALLALLGRRHRRDGDGAVSALRASVGSARHQHRRRARSTGATSPPAAGAAACCRSPTSVTTPATATASSSRFTGTSPASGPSTTVLFPLYYQHKDDHGYDAAVTPLLYFGNHAGESYSVFFPLWFRTASERTAAARRSRRSAFPSTIATGPASPSVRSSPSSTGAAATIGRTSPWCRCSGTSRIARRRSRPRWSPSTGTGAGAARRPTGSSRSSPTGVARGPVATTRRA